MKKYAVILSAAMSLIAILAASTHLLYLAPRQAQKVEQARATAYRDSLLAAVQMEIDSFTVMLDTLMELDRFLDSVWGDLPRDGWYLENKTKIAAQRAFLVSSIQARRVERAALVGE